MLNTSRPELAAEAQFGVPDGKVRRKLHNVRTLNRLLQNECDIDFLSRLWTRSAIVVDSKPMSVYLIRPFLTVSAVSTFSGAWRIESNAELRAHADVVQRGPRPPPRSSYSLSSHASSSGASGETTTIGFPVLGCRNSMRCACRK